MDIIFNPSHPANELTWDQRRELERKAHEEAQAKETARKAEEKAHAEAEQRRQIAEMKLHHAGPFQAYVDANIEQLGQAFDNALNHDGFDFNGAIVQAFVRTRLNFPHPETDFDAIKSDPFHFSHNIGASTITLNVKGNTGLVETIVTLIGIGARVNLKNGESPNGFYDLSNSELSYFYYVLISNDRSNSTSAKHLVDQGLVKYYVRLEKEMKFLESDRYDKTYRMSEYDTPEAAIYAAKWMMVSVISQLKERAVQWSFNVNLF